MSTQKYDSGFKLLGNLSVSNTQLQVNTEARTMTGVRATGSGELYIYSSFKDGQVDIICNDVGEPYKLVFTEASSYIPLNPQFFYGLSKIILEWVSGDLTDVSIIERMV